MTEAWTVRRMVGWMQADFAERGIDTPRLDAELLIAHVLGVPRLQLYLDLDRPLSAAELSTLRELVRRRREREPVAYLVGTKDFWKGRFVVDPRVLIPRPDTETLVERAIALLRGEVMPEGATHLEAVEEHDRADSEHDHPTPRGGIAGRDDAGESELVLDEEHAESVDATPENRVEKLAADPADSGKKRAERAAETRSEAAPRDGGTTKSALPDGPVIDLCTGSGCVVVSVASEVPDRRYLATDLSAGAIEVARENAQLAGVEVELIEGDLFAGRTGPFALVVSNPPYVEDAVIATLEPEVARHEPRLALAGGPDGLDVIRRLAKEAFARLSPGGALLIEIGADQGARAGDVLRDVGFSDVRVLPDLAGRDRVVEGWRRR